MASVHVLAKSKIAKNDLVIKGGICALLCVTRQLILGVAITDDVFTLMCYMIYVLLKIFSCACAFSHHRLEQQRHQLIVTYMSCHFVLKIDLCVTTGCVCFLPLNYYRYHLKDVIVGKIYFLLVRIKIKYMELAIVRKEVTGSGWLTSPSPPLCRFV